MKKFFTRSMLLSGALFFASIGLGLAQTSISGKVTDADTGEELAGVNVVVQGTVTGTITDLSGSFSLSTSTTPPFNVVVSYVGYASQAIEITDTNVSGLAVSLSSSTIMGQEIVISASRVEESILESPVTIEKFDVLAIRETPSPSFYDAIANMKGVDLSSQSITHKTVNARGFSSNGNTRFVQLIDGIDNQAPGLNFAAGNIVGISDIDLESAELIPGAASALYGPNALNGILLMRSKSPFEYQGLSAMARYGFAKIDSKDIDGTEVEGSEPYSEFSFRYAKAFNNKFAFKVSASYINTQDFVGQDYRDQTDVERTTVEPGLASQNPFYDGVNVYGDVTVTTGIVADAAIAAGNAPNATPEAIATAGQLSALRSLIPDGAAGAFTAPGFTEVSYVDNTTESLKINGALHYRLNEKMEASASFNWGSGSTVYTANDRFVLDNFSIWNAKLELKGDNFFLRGYTTQEDSGDTYAAGTLASNINQGTYLVDYLGTFVGARTGLATNGNPQDIASAHAIAKAFADERQPQPGTQAFRDLQEQSRNNPIPAGSLFNDETNMYHVEGMYNFKNEISFADVIAGFNFRRYDLVSGGTLFAFEDPANQEEFSYNEVGAYAQLSKALAQDKLKLQGSVRYDKNENFASQFSPRVSAVISPVPDHNIRLSFQRGFRIPTAQDQFIDLNVVTRRLIGSNPILVDRYNFETNTVYTAPSLAAARAANDISLLEEVEFSEFKTEKISTFEIGYKGLIAEKLFFDAYYYHSSYQDFIAEILFSQAVDVTDFDATDGYNPAPGYGESHSIEQQQDIVANEVVGGRVQEYGFDVNADGNVTSHGWAAGLDYSLPRGFRLTSNVSWNKLIDQQDLIDQGFRSSYNTPEWRTNFTFSNREVINNLGFNITYRWQDAFFWEASFGKGVIPAFGTVDAQISYKVPSIKSIFKLGAQNILDEKYTTGFGNPTMGGLYYLSITFDEFMN
ncbi:MAG: TonB-dependent receptor [Cyclobacteriaceae bacterium]